jgi:hypothetical protein
MDIPHVTPCLFQEKALHLRVKLILLHDSTITFQEKAHFPNVKITLCRGGKMITDETVCHTSEADTTMGDGMPEDMIVGGAEVQGAGTGIGRQ